MPLHRVHRTIYKQALQQLRLQIVGLVDTLMPIHLEAMEAFGGTILGATTGTYADLALLAPDNSAIMYAPTGTKNAVFAGNITTTGYQISSTPLLLDWIKSGSAPLATQVLVGGGTTSSPVGITGTEGQVLKIVSGVPQFAASSGGLSVTPYLATSNSNYTLDLNTYINSRSSTNTNITITLSNLDDGETGNIEVTYTGAVITFVVDSSYIKAII